MSARLDQLLDYHKQDPSDPFNIYALALEYQNFDKKQAEIYFNTLLDQHPDYIPTYYHAAKLQEIIGNIPLAYSIYECGIEKSIAQKENHALRELRNAYNLLKDSEED